MRSADYTPGQIPDEQPPVPASVWAPGDVHHTHEQIVKESPGGISGITGDPRDAEIERLRALVAENEAKQQQADETQAAAEQVAATA